MQIDRSRFLILSASIAAGATTMTGASALAGCGGSQTPADGDVKVATPVEVQPSSGQEPIDGSGPASDPELAGPANDKTLQEQCDGLEPPPGPHCESFFDTKADCSAFIEGLEPDAAEKAVQCLASRSRTQSICRYDALEDCFILGTSTTLAEPRLDKKCSSVVQMCASNRWARGDLTAESCGSVMAAVKDHLEGEMISCMAESCGVGSCVWRLR